MSTTMNTTVEPNNDRSDTPSLGEYKEKGDYISRKNERAIINAWDGNRAP